MEGVVFGPQAWSFPWKELKAGGELMLGLESSTWKLIQTCIWHLGWDDLVTGTTEWSLVHVLFTWLSSLCCGCFRGIYGIFFFLHGSSGLQALVFWCGGRSCAPQWAFHVLSLWKQHRSAQRPGAFVCHVMRKQQCPIPEEHTGWERCCSHLWNICHTQVPFLRMTIAGLGQELIGETSFNIKIMSSHK